MNKNVRTAIKADAIDPKEGMSLGEVRAALATMTAMPDNARVKVRVGYSAQVRSIEIIGQETSA